MVSTAWPGILKFGHESCEASRAVVGEVLRIMSFFVDGVSWLESPFISQLVALSVDPPSLTRPFC